MSKSGVGRGRGWLNLCKSQTAPLNPVGIVSNAQCNEKTSGNDADYSDATNDYKDMVNKVKHLNVNDDGIIFNQKIKYILENWMQYCQNSKQVEQCFDTLYKEALKDPELASKLVLMVSSRSFISQEIHDHNIRLLFLRKLQNDFEGSKELQKNNPSIFRNSVQLLGEFYNKARLGNGKQLTFMAAPLLSYLEMLLDTAECQDLQLLTTQLYLNGFSVKSEAPEKITTILNNVRLTLVSDKNISKESRLWLLLTLELANNQFGQLPIDVHTFFQAQLGDEAMTSFKVNAANCTSVSTHSNLSIQTGDNKTLDSYQSNVNVLQVSSCNETVVDPMSLLSYPDYNTSQQSHSTSGSFVVDTASGRRDHPANASGKCGRPILGIGVRLNKGKVDEAPSNANWRDIDNATMRGVNKHKNWEDSKKVGKGWEHDDRFENDYS